MVDEEGVEKRGPWRGERAPIPRYLDELKTLFLGPRGPLVLPLIGPARPSVRAKNLDPMYTGIYAS